MTTSLRNGSTALAVLFFFASPGLTQPSDGAASVEERLAALESTVAGLDTRLDARTTTGAGSLGNADRGLDVSGRVRELERELAALRADLQRVQRQAEAATREAAEARRSAMAAERLAQQAASRIR